MFTFLRRPALIATAALAAFSLAAVGLVADAAPAQAVAAVGPTLSLATSPTAGFSAGDPISFTYTATNNTAEVMTFPEAAVLSLEVARSYDDPAPTVSGNCDTSGLGFPDDYIVRMYGFDLSEGLEPAQSLTCTISYVATAWDVASGGVWTDFYYYPDGWENASAPGGWGATVPAVAPDVMVAIVGSARQGNVLSSTLGYWGPWTTPSYQWVRGSTPIAGATGPTYQVQAADAGKKLTLKVTGTSEGGGWITVSSAPTGTVPKLILTAPVPTIAGVVQVGSTLTGKTGVWGPDPVALTYQWSVGGIPVVGATAKTYLLPVSAAGKVVTFTVTGVKAGYTTATKTSAATAAVTALLPLTATPVPTVVGTVRVGSTLTGKTGVWGPDPVSLSYQWLVAGVPVSGATSKTFVLPANSVGKVVTFRVTGAKSGYATITKTSAATVAVAALP